MKNLLQAKRDKYAPLIGSEDVVRHMSTKGILVVILIFLFFIACGTHNQDSQLNPYAFTHVTIINPTDPYTAEDMTVMIEGDHITLPREK